jgi:class 3 adenylate cyclase/predicted ATPase
MQCSNCGTDNADRVKFCAECGAPLGIPCPHCAVRNPQSAAACSGCGRSLIAAPTLAERRQLTVFFADIVGSTTLAETLDPEDLRELYARYQAACAEVVARYEGHLAQYLGDGILAYFGYPAAHEDDANRAVRAGLDLLARIETIDVAGFRPHARIGIHTGLVVVGDVGAGARREQLALGETPNIAARLQSEAQPDTIVISDATRRLIAGQFDLEDLGSRALKGVSKPMPLFRVLGANAARSRFQARTALTGLTPFVGREREVETIRSAWQDASQGHGRMLLLRGEAGIGKSRLLAVAGQAARSASVESFEAECSPYQMNSPLHPFIEMLERRIGFVGADDPFDRIESFVAGRGVKLEEGALALSEILSIPSGSRYPEIDVLPAKRRQWSIETLARIILHNGDRLPILLRIEDLHWADPSTLDVLDEMIAHLANLPVLIVATARPEFARWSDRAHCRLIEVEPLPPDATQALVAKVIGPKPLPVLLVSELVARTGGIPLFVEAVTRTVLDAGILRELPERYEMQGPLPPGLIPATVQDSLMGRIDRLGSDRAIAQLAATIGREFSFELLKAVLGKSTDELSRGLRHLVDLDLVSETGVPPNSSYTFKHALIQDAAYESLLKKTRQEFHGKIAEALVERFPDLAETNPEVLARHYEGAGRIEEATDGWMKAGFQAEARSGLRECLAYYQRTLALFDANPTQDRERLQAQLRTQLALSRAMMSTLGWGSSEVEAACTKAFELAEKLGDAAGVLQTRLGLQTFHMVRGKVAEARAKGQGTLDLALATGNPIIEIVCRHAYGYPVYYTGDFIEARAQAEKGLALYNPERERQLVGFYHVPSSFACASFLAMSLWFMGYPEQAERARQLSWSIIEALDDHAATAFGLGNTLMIHYARRDAASVARIAEEGYNTSIEGGYLIWAAFSQVYLGWARGVTGDLKKGLAEMRAGLDAFHATGSRINTPQFSLMRAELLWLDGRDQEARDAIAEGLRHASEFQEQVFVPELHRLLAEIQVANGETLAAEASLRRAIEIAQEQKARMLELRAAIALAKLKRSRGEIAERTLIQPLYDWFQEGLETTPELLEARAMLDSLKKPAVARG